MSPEDVVSKYEPSGVQIKTFESDDDVLVIEGTKESLMFVSELFAAQAQATGGGYCISPLGAGRAWFAPGSTKGIYIHLVPTDDGRGTDTRIGD